MNGNGAVVDGEVVSSTALATVPTAPLAKAPNAAELFRAATDVAGVCGAIVKTTAQAIQGRKYVKVEGWQAIATAYGCAASARDVERVATGFRCIGEVRRMSDGAVIAQAEGFLGDDETTWANRPEYAKRAMCQTRAISRACRSAFAFVVVMIDASLSTTPAEEVPDGGFHDAHAPLPAPAGVDKLREQVTTVPQKTPPRQASSAAGANPSMAMGFGKDKGKPISSVDASGLRWYIEAVKRDLADPSKAQWQDKARTQLAALEAELATR